MVALQGKDLLLPDDSGEKDKCVFGLMAVHDQYGWTFGDGFIRLVNFFNSECKMFGNISIKEGLEKKYSNF